MTAERWDQVRPLFFELSELGAEDRAVRLESLSKTDPELHAQLTRLLAAHDESDELLGSFEDLMSQPGFDPSITHEQAHAPDPHGLIGRTVSHYKVLELLGAGGMGILYKALDTQLGRTVALKFLPPQWSLDEAFKARFEREARAVAALDHPNVCTVHEIGETEEGQLFIAMAFYQGETVKEKIARGPLEVDEALNLAEQAASGLAAAHRAGLVHRDIKPANLMVSEEEAVLKILDFGLAKTGETALTESGMRLGTPAYMSPEQTHGEEVDARTDLWSLGVVLYEMLTGRRPFRGGNDSALIDAIRREEPRPPGELRDSLPENAEDLVLRLLSKDPAGRAAESETLENYLGRRGAVAVSPPVRSRRWQLIGLILLVLIGTAALRWLLPVADPADASHATIAVMEFRPVGEEASAIVAGITVTTRDRLAIIEGIEVIRSTTSAVDRLRGLPATAIAEELGADYILTAAVERQSPEGEVEVRPELYGANGTRIRFWDRNPILVSAQHLPTLESSIAEDIAYAIDLTIGEAARSNLTQPSSNPAAYEAFIRGTRVARGEPRFEEALALDSTLAPAHFLLALEAMLRFQNTRSSADSADMHDAALAAIRHAPSYASGYLAMGLFHRTVTLDADSALFYMDRAQELAPGDGGIKVMRATALWNVGRLDSALVEARRSAGLDPLSGSAVSRVSRILLWQHRLDEAWESHLEVRPLVIDGPGMAFAIADGPLILAAMGMADSARALLSRTPAVDARTATALFLNALHLQGWLVEDSLLLRVCRERPEGILGYIIRDEDQLIGCALGEWRRGNHTLARAMADSALAGFQSLVRARPQDGSNRMRLAYAHFLLGDQAAALVHADSAVALLDSYWDYYPGAMNAIAYAQLAAMSGDMDRAIRQLTPMIEGYSPLTRAWLRVDPAFDRIRSDPRFEALLRLRG